MSQVRHLKRFERILFVFLWKKGEGTRNFACWHCSVALVVREAGEMMGQKPIAATQNRLGTGKASGGCSSVPG